MSNSSEAGNAYNEISHEVGARLAERRKELKKSLRSVAADSSVSASHLSDIENGLCQVSLPALLRIVRALDLTITELLPTIGGHHVRQGSLLKHPDAATDLLSHPELQLTIEVVTLHEGSSHVIENSEHHDVLLHVLRGSITFDSGREELQLTSGDTLDTERVTKHTLRATSEVTLLTARAPSTR